MTETSAPESPRDGAGGEARIVGRAIDAQERGVAATVDLLCRLDGVPHRDRVSAGADGAFEVAAPGTGPWALVVSCAGYRDARLQIHERPTECVVVSLTRTLAVELRVIDALGAPVPSCPIVARWGGDARNARGLTTDSEGRARLDDCVAEGERVRLAAGMVVRGQVPSVERVVRAGSATVVLTLPSSRRLRVHVSFTSSPNEVFALDVRDGERETARIPWPGGADATLDLPSTATDVRVLTATGPGTWVPLTASTSEVDVTAPGGDLRVVTVTGDGRDWECTVVDRDAGGPPSEIPFSTSSGEARELLVRAGLSYTLSPPEGAARSSIVHVVDVDSPDVVRLDDGALVPFAVRVTDVDGRLLPGATVDAVMSPSRASDPVASALALDGVARMQLVEHGVYRFCARLDDVSTDAVLARVERGGEVTCVVDAEVRLTIVASWLDERARTQCGVLPAGREVLIHREGDELTVGVPRRSWMLVRLGSRFFVIEGGVESRSVTIPGDACARTLTVRDGDDRALGGMLFVVAKEELAPGVRSAWFGRMGGEAAVADLADGEYRCVLKSSDSMRVLADLRVYDGDESLSVEPPLSEEPERRASSGFIGLTVHGSDGRQCIPLFSVEHSGARVSLAEGVELIE